MYLNTCHAFIDMATSIAAEVQNAFRAFRDPSGSSSYFGNLCSPKQMCGGSANPSAGWKQTLSAINAFFFGCGITFDAGCGLQGAVDALPNPLQYPSIVAPGIQNINCTSTCCSTNGDTACGPALFGIGVGIPTGSSLCMREQGAAIAAMIGYITANDDVHVQCSFNIDATVGDVTIHPDTGMVGAFVCTPEAQNGAAIDTNAVAKAYHNTLNPIWRLRNQTCSCHGSAGLTANTSMCSMRGVCQTSTALNEVNAPMNVSLAAGVCSCSDGWEGGDCSQAEPSACPTPCNGTCDAETTHFMCVCNNGYTGPTCEIPICPIASHNQKLCSGNGNCQLGVCICEEGFTGVNCSAPTDPDNAAGNPKSSGGTKTPASTQNSGTPKNSKVTWISKYRLFIVGVVVCIVAAIVIFLVNRYHESQPAPSEPHDKTRIATM